MATSGLNKMPAGTKRAIVTGSSSGIGLAIAENLLAGGWAVSGFDIAPARISHAAFDAVQIDLCDELRLAAAVQSVKTPAHALVHAAGILRVGKLGQLEASDAQLMWQLHVSALSTLANIIVPHMATAGFGRVVIIGSRVAICWRPLMRLKSNLGAHLFTRNWAWSTAALNTPITFMA